MKNALRAVVQSVLERPLAFSWSVQGFGMMRTYFGGEKKYRLNIWDSALAVPNVSIIHDHPWDFTSWVIAGRFRNVRFSEHPHGVGFEWATIKTGEGGGPDGERGHIRLLAAPVEHYERGATYYQHAEEIHASAYDDGTITLNDRVRRDDGDHARVFWLAGRDWVDAEPRPPTRLEVVRATERALETMATL